MQHSQCGQTVHVGCACVVHTTEVVCGLHHPHMHSRPSMLPSPWPDSILCLNSKRTAAALQPAGAVLPCAVVLDVWQHTPTPMQRRAGLWEEQQQSSSLLCVLSTALYPPRHRWVGAIRQATPQHLRLHAASLCTPDPTTVPARPSRRKPAGSQIP